MSAVLEVKNLCKSFNQGFSPSVSVLKGLSFSLPEGSVTGFLGPNGAGKSTTFKCLFELVKRDEGEISFFGAPLSLESKAMMGFLPERPQFYEDLTAEECLLFYGRLTKPFEAPALKKRIHELLKKTGLYEKRRQKLKTFSKGMLQKVGLIQAFLPNPRLIILDEPFSGLDPEGRFYVAELIEEARAQGLTVFFSSHILQDVERVCDRLVILREGEIVFEGDFSELPWQMGESRHILYLREGKRLRMEVSSAAAAASALKKILSEGGMILSVHTKGCDLETAYMGMASGKKPEGGA